MNIRLAKPSDLPAIIELMREFAEFEKLLEYFVATEEKLGLALFGDGAFAEAFVAETDGKLAAYAIFFPYLATFRAQRGLFLEDIFITKSQRGEGLGEKMLRAVARRAKERGFERIDFHVLDWNTPAIGFYERFGAEHHDDETHFKFIDEAFRKLAE